MNDTEATCEVVRIVSISKHTNADRLEIAKFAFASDVIPDYQVVVGKGEFVVGQNAVYISDDMLVPVARPEFAFLIDKAKAGYHRVRACRLRGAMSTGLLIKPSPECCVLERLSVGKDMSDALGVLKYVSPLEQSQNIQSGKQATSKRTLFGRLCGKVLGWFYSPPKIPEYGVLSLRKVPDLFKDGEPVILTEKIHGSNIRFGRVSGRVYIGSHHTEKSDSRPWLLRKLFPRYKAGGFYKTDVWTGWFNRVFSTKERLSELPDNVIFYGELFGPGIQPWTYGLLETQVMVFDAYDLKAKKWFDWMAIGEILPHMLDMVPVINWSLPYSKEDVKTAAESATLIKTRFTTDLKHKCSDREGVVVRSEDWKRAGKMVSDKYLASEH